jgi:hypothetical protein
MSYEMLYITYPRYIPAPPAPAMTRPMISASMVGAAPQTALPISKSKTLRIMRNFVSTNPYRRPIIRIKATEDIGNPMPTHGKFSMS